MLIPDTGGRVAGGKVTGGAVTVGVGALQASTASMSARMGKIRRFIIVSS
jgi:hypothetical protein